MLEKNWNESWWDCIRMLVSQLKCIDIILVVVLIHVKLFGNWHRKEKKNFIGWCIPQILYW